MNKRKFLQYLSVGLSTLVVGGVVANSLVDNPMIGNEGLLAQINRVDAVMDFDVLTYEMIEELIEDISYRNIDFHSEAMKEFMIKGKCEIHYNSNGDIIEVK